MTGSRNSSGRTSRPARPTPRVAGARSRGRRFGDAVTVDDRAVDSTAPQTGTEAAGGHATDPADSAVTGAGDSGVETQPARRPRPSPRPRPRRVTEPATTATEVPAAVRPSRTRRAAVAARTTATSAAGLRRLAGRWWLVALLAVGVVLAAIITGYLFVDWRHASARAEARREVPSLAKTYAAKILSYDYRHIRQDADTASAVTVGDYRRQYRQSMDQLIIPQATGLKAVVRAEVLNAGVTEVSDDGRQAVVVVFANQTVTNTRIQGPRVDQVRVRLTMVRDDGSWRVSKVDSL